MPYKDSNNGERGAITYLHGQVGLHKILSLLESEDACVQIHAVKVIANLAAEEANQEKIVEAGGLSSLLILLRSSEDETIRRIAAGAPNLRKVDLRMYSAYQGHELADEGAMPPQLPTPASHAELGPLLRRGVTELKEDLSIGVQSIVHQRWQHRRRRRPLKRNESGRCYHLRFSYRTRLGMLSKEFDSFKLERFEIGKQLDRFYEMLRSVAFTESTTRLLRLSPLIVSSSSWSSSVNSLSKVLISSLFAFFNWSRSLNSSNRELVNLLFTTFNRSSWSRSMESVGESMSTVLINSTSVAIAVPGAYPWKARAQSSLILRLHNSIRSRSMKKNWSMWSRSINLRCYQVMFWRLFRFYAKSLMSLDSRSVGTRNKQSVVELDFKLRLVSFYLSFFLKSKLGSEVNKSEIKSHRKSKIQNIGSTEYRLIVSHMLNFNVRKAVKIAVGTDLIKMMNPTAVNRYKRFSKSGLAAQIATGPLPTPVNMSAFEKKNNETILVFDRGGGTFVGTTTSVVLAQGLIDEGVKVVAAGGTYLGEGQKRLCTLVKLETILIEMEMAVCFLF
nr:armadillo repeat-containing kinesin-like protein 2 [Ipomoea batatas]